MHIRGIAKREHQQQHQILLFRGELFSQSFYESAVQESRQSQSKTQHAGGYPYSIFGSSFTGEQILRFNIMEVLLWSGPRVGDGVR